MTPTLCGHERPHGSRAADVRPLVLLLDLNRELAALFTEWLTCADLRVLSVAANESMIGVPANEVSATIANLPFPRMGGVERLLPRADSIQGKPIVVLSPGFRSDVAPQGPIARELGVAAVLPASVRRDALIDTMRSVLQLER